MSEILASGRVTLLAGDMLETLETLDDNSVDSVVCDPPYGLKFMGMLWDNEENVAFQTETWAKVYRVLKPGGHLVAFSGTRTYHRMTCAIEDAGFEVRDMVSWLYGTSFPKSHAALKPAHEPICLARKPLSEPTVAKNVFAWSTAALNIDGCRIGTEGGTKGCGAGPSNGILDDGLNGSFGIQVPGLGRWPANVCHDGSDEVLAAFPETGPSRINDSAGGCKFFMSGDKREEAVSGFGDSGSAARFFYSAKANKGDRCDSKHPTVKPVKLMQWLCRLVTPPGGTILDCFAGSGTTGEAAVLEGFKAILCEREKEYLDDIRRRMSRVMFCADERQRESIKAQAKDKPVDIGPLFDAMSHAI